MKVKAKSSFIALFINFKIEHLINPWIIEVDFDDETITIGKRNWYFIGKDTDTLAFRFIRKITVNEHLFGADVFIKAIGGSVNGKYFPKSKIRLIKKELIEYNKTKKRHIIFT